MPLYEYECTQCGCRSEVFQKVTDPPLRKCKKCGGALRKLISAPAIQFKGSGWYITDYAKKSGPQDEGKKKEKAPAKEPCAPASAEAKPKAEKKPSSATGEK
jgi:putative FmdB family regulatory protein